MNRRHCHGLIGAAAAVLLLAAPAGAVPTARYKISTFDEFDKGDPRGTFISSDGEVMAGLTRTRLKTSAAMIWSATTDAAGTVYFGTGDRGHLLAVKNNAVRKVADLKSVLITSLAPGRKGKILAGTMPDARILEVDTRTGKWRQLAKLPASHVWALIHDEKRGKIFAATGSPGKIFSIPAGGGKAQEYYDPDEKHLLCLARDLKGNLLTGSAEKAILYRVTSKGKGSAIHDFDGNELRDVQVDKAGTIYVAVNQFTQKTSGLPRFDRSKKGEGGTAIEVVKKKKKKTTSKVRAQELRPGAKSGKGGLFRLGPRGEIDQLLSLSKGYFTDLAMDRDGVLWAGEGTKGKVFMVRPDRTVLTAFDVDERQVLALAVSGKNRYFGTGDAGAIYRVSDRPAAKPIYLTEVFDAKFPAKWGNLSFRSSGPMRLETRTGNTTKPDATWSAWKPMQNLMAGTSRTNSPEGRYLQARLTLLNNKARLRSFAVYYRPFNQRARVTEITATSETKKKVKKPKVQVIKLSWKVDNPDKDPLVYRIYHRAEMGIAWRKISGDKPLAKTSFDWSTESIADGYYRIKVVVSDEQANSPENTLTDPRISPRILVDNRKPEVLSLVPRYPWVAGMARDTYSPISRIEYKLDDKPWRLLAPLDTIYDNMVESFRFRLPVDLPKGVHTIAVRIMDEANNAGVTLMSFVR